MGFLGQLLIQSQAMPGEMPRATILRLTGIDIAPHVYHTPDKHSVCADMPGMTMDNVTQAVSADNEGDHDHMSGHPSHHDGSCPLCPLLHLPVFLFTALVILLALAFIRWQRHVNIVNPVLHLSSHLVFLSPVAPLCLRSSSARRPFKLSFIDRTRSLNA